MVSSPPLPSKGAAISSIIHQVTPLTLPTIMEGSYEEERSTSWKKHSNKTSEASDDPKKETMSMRLFPNREPSETSLDLPPLEDTLSELETVEDWIQEYHSLQRRKSSVDSSSSASTATGILRLFHHVTELDQDLEYMVAAAKSRQKKRHSFQTIINCGDDDDVSTVAPIQMQPPPKNDSREIHWFPPKSPRAPKDTGDLTWNEFMTKRAGKTYRPFFSMALILVCTVMLFFSFYKNDWQIEPWSSNSAIGPKPEVLLALGGLVTVKLLGNVSEWYRIVTAMVLHGGILHWLGNVAGILVVGPPIERVHGGIVMGFVFVVAGAAANLCSAVYSPWGLSVGASGGICAWLGIALSKAVARWPILCALHDSNLKFAPAPQSHAIVNDATAISHFPFLATKVVILFEMMLLALIGLLPWIDQFAHLGGLFFGLVVGNFIFQPSGASNAFLGLIKAAVASKKTKGSVHQFLDSRCFRFVTSQRIMRWILFSGAVALCTANAIWLYQSEEIRDLPCHNCRYMNCAPFTTSLSKQCDPCNYIQIEYVIKGSYQIANFTLTDDETDESSNVAYLIETKCPYGETVTYISPMSPVNRDDWMEHCHDHCEL
jgi:membrane associated rhomboid family serine protease